MFASRSSLRTSSARVMDEAIGLVATCCGGCSDGVPLEFVVVDGALLKAVVSLVAIVVGTEAMVVLDGELRDGTGRLMSSLPNSGTSQSWNLCGTSFDIAPDSNI